MKLYLVKGKWIFGDSAPHNLPLEVETVPYIEAGIAELDGEQISIANGRFAVQKLDKPLSLLTVDGKPCEALLATHNMTTATAVGRDWRALLPFVADIENHGTDISTLLDAVMPKDIFS